MSFAKNVRYGWSRMTSLSRFLVSILFAALVVFGAYMLFPGLFERITGTATTEIKGIEIPNTNVGTQTEAAPTLTPVFTPAQVRAENAGTWRHLGIAWNGQIGLIYANGGAQTARGSIMEQYGLSVSIARQDMYDVMQAQLIQFANEFAGGNADPRGGVHSVTIMGDAAPGFLAALQPQLDRLNLHARIIGATGRSYGEDKCMGQPAWLDNPQAARGQVIAGVLRDGDIHICLIWAQANGIPVNPDPTTLDRNALNFLATNSFQEADQALISRQCENRPVVSEGRRTGETAQACVRGTATWTPGDVNVVRNNGGVVSLLSTRENGAQMFATIVVIDEWARANPATVTNFLKAALDGSATVARDRAALRQAAAFSAQVWGEQDADYWERYYHGRVEDVPGTGRQVRLGGSQALGLASNLEYFLPAGRSIYDRVYRTFGDLDRRLYPDVMPEYPTDVLNTSFLERIRAHVGNVGRGAVFGQFSGSETQQVASRSYSINFEQGSARILPSSNDDLEQILRNVTVGSNLAIRVDGYTSSEGDTASNQRLSEARAQAIRAWLLARAPAGLISAERIRVTGFGESNLITDSSGVEDRNRSRRVEIRLLGSD